MDLDSCRRCRNYSPNDMYCQLHLRGIERISSCAIRDLLYVVVVRCKDCKHRILNENYDNKKPGSLKAVCELDTGDLDELGRYAENDDWFCADGERKDDDI